MRTETWPRSAIRTRTPRAALLARSSGATPRKRRPRRPDALRSRLEFCADEDELVAEDLVGHFAVGLGADFALQAPDATLLGDEVHDLRAGVFLLLEPRGERGAGRDESRDVIAGVEVFALPVHLICDELLGG